MWKWLNCYLSGQHDFGVTCADGAIFLSCIHCGRRSNGWALQRRDRVLADVPSPARRAPSSHLLPFVPRGADRHDHTR